MNSEIVNRKRKETLKRNNSVDIIKLLNSERIHKTQFIRVETKNTKRNHSVEFQSRLKCPEEKSLSQEKFFDIYTYISKKLYPLIFNTDDKIIRNICEKHNKIISLFCFTCNEHFCLECKSEHVNHFLQELKEIKIKEKDLINEENKVRENTTLFFEKYFGIYKEKKEHERLEKFMKEIIRFKYFIIAKYKEQKENFYNIYNFLYVFGFVDHYFESGIKMHLKEFQGFHGFKALKSHLKYFYEKQKYRWLLKNLISYRKENQERDNEIKKRKKKYKFNDLNILLKDYGFNENICEKMKDIIGCIEKKRNDLKEKIYDFIINAVDIYKKYKEKTNIEKDLNAIKEKIIENDFKKKVEIKLNKNEAECEDFEKFIKSNDFCYKQNNKNNVIRYFVDYDDDMEFEATNYDELRVYNYFKIKEYKSKFIKLKNLNVFIAQNYGNKYEKRYGVNNFEQKEDFLNYTHNIDERVFVDEIKYEINIDANDKIVACNKNCTCIKRYDLPEGINYKCNKNDNTKKETRDDILINEIDKMNKISNNKNNIEFKKDLETKIYDFVNENDLIIIKNEDSEFNSNVEFGGGEIPNSYNLKYEREICNNKNQKLDYNENPIKYGDFSYKIEIRNGEYKTNCCPYSSGDDPNICSIQSGSPYPSYSYYNPYEREENERERREREKRERKEREKREREERERKEREKREREERERREREERERREREERERREREKREREEREKREREERERREREERKRREREERERRERERLERERRERERREREEIERRERERRERERREREERERRERERRERERRDDIKYGRICPYCYSSNVGKWKTGLRVLTGIFTLGISEATIHKRYCYNCDNYFSAYNE